jgi:hypothetical protein
MRPPRSGFVQVDLAEVIVKFNERFGAHRNPRLGRWVSLKRRGFFRTYRFESGKGALFLMEIT